MYRCNRSIAIDHTKVSGSEDLIDFPALISISDTFLKSTANGGDIENPNGYDIIFTSDVSGTNQLDHEIASYNDTTGELLAWVKIPTVKYDEDTVFYIFYSDPDITESQENVADTWDVYELIMHMNDDSTSSTVIDSSVHTHNGVYSDSIDEVSTSNVSDPDGKILQALSFDGVDQKITASGTLSPDYITMSAWARSSSITKQEIMNDAQDNWHIRIAGQGSSPPTCIVRSGGVYAISQFPTTQTDGEWHLIAGTYDGTTAIVYVDGVAGTPNTDTSGPLDPSPGDLYIGVHPVADQNPMNGSIDELRLATSAFTAGWIGTEFNNQDSPPTFIFVGEPVCRNNKFIQTLNGDPLMGVPVENVASVMGIPW